MVTVGIIGATGYVGVELLRLLINHKKIKVASISSTSFEGESIEKVYANMRKSTTLECTSPDEVLAASQVVFAALPHGLSEDIAEKCVKSNKVCIDLGADFRLESEKEYIRWYGKSFDKPSIHPLSIYGLPELNREKIRHLPIIANPGCYPTSIELGLMPALKEKLIDTKGIIIDSKSGVTGAGRTLSESSHFPACNENINPYKIGTHRHTPEIEQTLSKIAGESVSITFVPHLIPVNRGILSTIYCSMDKAYDIEKIHEIYFNYYKNEPFVRVLDIGSVACLRNIKYSNFCDISIHTDDRTNKLIIASALDNMVKGAAGQAIQNMNIALGFKETEGLEYIPPAF